MSVFAYEALDAKGKKSEGVIEADSPRQVRQKLRVSGLNAIVVSEASGKETSDTTKKQRLIVRWEQPVSPFISLLFSRKGNRC